MNKDDLRFSFDDFNYHFETEDIVDTCFKQDDNSLILFYNLLSFGDIVKDSNYDVKFLLRKINSISKCL